MNKENIIVDKLAENSGPYSHGSRIRIGETDLIFVSGQVSIDIEGNTVGKGDIVVQTEQVLKNMETVLQTARASLANVIKVTVFLRNMEHRDAVAKVRKRFFKDNLPASTLIEVTKLAHQDWLIEIEAIAVVSP